MVAVSSAVPARPLAPSQSFRDVAVNGLRWNGYRFHDVRSFSTRLRRRGTTYAAHTRCLPILMTIPRMIGSRRSPLGERPKREECSSRT
jgi:hypothetical protein